MSSRFGDDGDGESEVPYEFWDKILERAFHGPRAAARLRDLEAALLAIPRKRLILGAVAKDGDVCAIGAFVAFRKSQKGTSLQDAIAELEALKIDAEDNYDAGEATADLGKEHGMSRTMARCVAARQDEELHQLTPEERYEEMLAWVRGAIVEAEKPLPAKPKPARLIPTRSEERARERELAGQGRLL